MTPQPQNKSGSGQLNLNTVLLSICVMLSGWALKSIDDLRVQVGKQGENTSQNSGDIIGIDKVLSDQSSIIHLLDIRINRLETQQIDRKNKN